MKIGLGSYAYPWNIQRGMTAEDLLNEGVRHGVDVVQVCDNFDLANLDWPSLSAAAKGQGIELQVGNIGGQKEAMLAVKIAAQIGSPIARFVIGQSLITQSVSEVADDLREAAKVAEGSGVRLAIENHDFFKSHQIAEIIEAIGHGCAATVDTANSISNLEGTECVAKYLGAHAICLHAKDISVEREFHMYGFRVFGVPAGTGAVDFQFLRDNLPNLQSVILEQWCPPKGNQPPLALEKDTIAQSLAHLRAVWSN